MSRILFDAFSSAGSVTHNVSIFEQANARDTSQTSSLISAQVFEQANAQDTSQTSSLISAQVFEQANAQDSPSSRAIFNVSQVERAQGSVSVVNGLTVFQRESAFANDSSRVSLAAIILKSGLALDYRVPQPGDVLLKTSHGVVGVPVIPATDSRPGAIRIMTTSGVKSLKQP